MQCVAVCSGTICSGATVKQQPVPPCHQSNKEPAKNVPVGCGHELILADAAQAPIAQAFHANLFAAPILPQRNFTSIAVLILETNEQDFSPPGLAAVSSTVLRI
jgi:hypothetical protein